MPAIREEIEEAMRRGRRDASCCARRSASTGTAGSRRCVLAEVELGRARRQRPPPAGGHRSRRTPRLRPRAAGARPVGRPLAAARRAGSSRAAGSRDGDRPLDGLRRRRRRDRRRHGDPRHRRRPPRRRPAAAWRWATTSRSSSAPTASGGAGDRHPLRPLRAGGRRRVEPQLPVARARRRLRRGQPRPARLPRGAPLLLVRLRARAATPASSTAPKGIIRRDRGQPRATRSTTRRLLQGLRHLRRRVPAQRHGDGRGNGNPN